MFEGMTGIQKLQFLQWCIYASSVCFLAHCLRLTLQAFWQYLVSKEKNKVFTDFDKKSQIFKDFPEDYTIFNDFGENAAKPRKTQENTEKTEKGNEK